MKKLIISATLVFMVPLMSIGQSTLGPGVMGSTLTIKDMPHNFSSDTWNAYDLGTTLGQQICQPCHTPHNGTTTVGLAPLWNHQLTSGNPYTFYKSVKDGSQMGVTAIDGFSQLCLSCHDGTVALGAFGGQSGAGSGTITGGALLGTDLSNDHPVSIDYQATLTAGYGGLQPTTYVYGIFDTLTYTYAFSTATNAKTVASLLDSNGKVQCTSCHGAHSNSRGYQLKMTNRGSQLCLACHKK